jgi:oxalate decarboxylase
MTSETFMLKEKSTTFNLPDWIAHTPKDVLAKNFGVDPSVFSGVPAPDPYIVGAGSKPSTEKVTPSSAGVLSGKSSFVYRTLKSKPEKVPGNGGTFYKIDSTNFPVAKTIAATFVTLKPRGLREIHW